MPLPITKQERRVLTAIAVLLILGVVGMLFL
jgi:hypothetical protein